MLLEKEWLVMPSPAIEKALAYLDGLEVDRKAALALSEQKAEEAKLIKARQEGFQAAIEILGGGLSVGPAEVDPDLKEPAGRRSRRPIPQMILRELSFSGRPMKTTEIAKAIQYNAERTETALKRMESAGQVLRNEGGRWAIVLTADTKYNGEAVTREIGKLIDRPQPPG